MTEIKTTTTPAKSALPFGALFGVLLTLLTMSIYFYEINLYEDKQMQAIVSIGTYLVLPLLLIFIAVKNYKDKHNQGFLLLVEGIKIGVVVMLIAAIVSGVFNLIFMYVFPELSRKNVPING